MSGEKINLEINNRNLSIEISKIGRQADGSAFLRYGDTIMFVSATSKKEMKEPKPFLPQLDSLHQNGSTGFYDASIFFNNEEAWAPRYQSSTYHLGHLFQSPFCYMVANGFNKRVTY